MPISTRALVQFCHRVGTAVRTGIDARRLWEMEERHATGATRGAIGTIRQHVNAVVVPVVQLAAILIDKDFAELGSWSPAAQAPAKTNADLPHKV